jgi:hypothetical protein
MVVDDSAASSWDVVMSCHSDSHSNGKHCCTDHSPINRAGTDTGTHPKFQQAAWPGAQMCIASDSYGTHPMNIGRK